MRWLRLYETVLDDPKVQRLRPELFKAWINLLCVACRKDGVIPADMADLAFMLRTDDETALGWVRELEAAGLIDRRDDFTRQPHDWDDYQYASDNSTARVQAFRARKLAATNGHDPAPKGGGKPETKRNVSGETLVNAPESDSESETSLRMSYDDDGKIAVGPWKRPAILPDDDGALQARLSLVQKSFRAAQRDRILAGMAIAADPLAYLDRCLSELRPKREKSPAPSAEPKSEPVWIVKGSPAWAAWDRVKPRQALESKYHPGEWGTYRDSLFPPAHEARA